MKNKKLIAIYSLTHNDKIQSLRSFLNDTNLMYDYQKTNLNSDEFKSYLKSTCVIIEEKLTSTIDYYQHTKSGELEFKKAKEKYKDLFILLKNYKLELISLGITESEYLAFKKDTETAFDFDIDTKKKSEPLPNYLEIKKEFEEFIKIDKVQEKEKYLFKGQSEESNRLFNYLVKKYRPSDKTRVKFINILYYMKNSKDMGKHKLKVTQEKYTPIIKKEFGFEIKKYEKSDFYLDDEEPILKQLKTDFLKDQH
jgi:hypothetical protein